MLISRRGYSSQALTVKRPSYNPDSVIYLLCEVRKVSSPFWVSVSMTKLDWLISRIFSDSRIL